MTSHNNSTPTIVGALAIATIIGAAAYVLTQSNTSFKAASPTAAANTSQTATKETTSQPSDSATASSTATDPVAATSTDTGTANSATSGYKDGAYSATATYAVPKGFSNDITVNITVKDGVISSVSSDHDYTDRESGMYVDAFDSRLSSLIIGKALDVASQIRVGGASLTTYGFNDALAAIASQAKA